MPFRPLFIAILLIPPLCGQVAAQSLTRDSVNVAAHTNQPGIGPGTAPSTPTGHMIVETSLRVTNETRLSATGDADEEYWDYPLPYLMVRYGLGRGFEASIISGFITQAATIRGTEQPGLYGHFAPNIGLNWSTDPYKHRGFYAVLGSITLGALGTAALNDFDYRLALTQSALFKLDPAGRQALNLNTELVLQDGAPSLGWDINHTVAVGGNFSVFQEFYGGLVLGDAGCQTNSLSECPSGRVFDVRASTGVIYQPSYRLQIEALVGYLLAQNYTRSEVAHWQGEVGLAYVLF